tara:strand:- start:4 stop:318 length:315 start_codon:yes stop_codon:yes gene_type:complete
MGNKVLQADSIYNQFDTDGDGIVTDEEMARAERMIQIENDDKRQDAQRNMAWLAVISMVTYPLLAFIMPESRLSTLASMSDMLFMSQAGIVAAFFGAQAFMSKK